MPLRYTSSEAFAKAALAALDEDERTLKWLSRRSGIDYSTLRSQLLEKPARLTYRNAVAIADVVLPQEVAA
jgi:lambda repressor-like predicted transcriptional regulator